MHFPDKSEAKEISWKLWQASGVTAKVCYLALCNPYGTDLRVNLVVDSALHLQQYTVKTTKMENFVVVFTSL